MVLIRTINIYFIAVILIPCIKDSIKFLKTFIPESSPNEGIDNDARPGEQIVGRRGNHFAKLLNHTHKRCRHC